MRKNIDLKKFLAIITLFFLLNQSQTLYAQFSNEEVDYIIERKVWCVTDINVDGNSGRPDGKWLFFSGMNFINGEDDKVDDITDIIEKKYTDDGMSITYFDKRKESLVKINFTINKNKIHPDFDDDPDSDFDKNDKYVGLTGVIEIDNQTVNLKLSCTSIINGIYSSSNLPTNNWDGN